MILTKQFEFKKYLPISDMDYKWGFVVNDIGYAQIPKNSDYPPKGHPGTHMFSWETGRTLNTFHFVLITEGEGVFESQSFETTTINAGDGFVLFPGEWHRYKPLKESGWTESWIGFSGLFTDSIMQEYFFKKEQPVIRNCANMLVQNLMKSLFQLIREEPLGYQRTASGVCIQLMAEICNTQKAAETPGLSSSIISRSKYLMNKKIDEQIDFHLFCKNNRISYSKFRADFKHQTGFAPLQYFVHLKIEKAKDLLQNTELKAKEIAFKLGFQSENYFGRIFKIKTGKSPHQFRKKG
ncbi:AraC family transcriptional regulator [Mariniphaga sediminis]|uniref:AraC family transcriptional regulator n=1 Tax=Mariniphaga sediminis TaxID=1628158 RepID=UPI0035678D7F